MNEQFDGARALVRNDRRVARDAKERLTVDLRRRILTLELEPGIHLDETGLSQEYGISRTPLRDVFRQLAGEGYLVIRDNRGAMVSPMSHKTMRDFFQTAPLVYASISRLAAERADAAGLDALRAAQDAFRKAVAAGSPDDMVYWNDRFHFVLGEMADNQYLMPSLRRLLIDHARIGQTFWRPKTPEMRGRIETACAQHDQLVALIEAGDAEGAVKLTLDHWALSRAHLDMFVRPDPLPIEGG